MEHLYDWTQLCIHCKQSAMDIDDSDLSCLPDAEENKPETWEAYVARRSIGCSERIKMELLGKVAPVEKAEGENDYERAKLDVYPRPTF